jgi:hypothetical protein
MSKKPTDTTKSLASLKRLLIKVESFDPFACPNGKNLAYMTGRSELARQILRDYLGEKV